MKQSNFLFKSSAKISIILPALNEEKRIPPLLNALRSISIDPQNIELIVVDDGSTDNTSLICQRIINDFFPKGKVITKPKNTGKGSALRTGVAAANAPIIITMDADMATDLQAIDAVLLALETQDVVVGSRNLQGSTTHGTSIIRRLVTTGFSFFNQAMTRHNVSDTQCGFKAYQGPIAKILFATSVINGFSHDAEILDLAFQNNLSIQEIAVNWTAIPESKVRIIKDSCESFYEFCAYRMKLRNPQPIQGLIVASQSDDPFLTEEILHSLPDGSLCMQRDSGIEIFFTNLENGNELRLVNELQKKFPNYELHRTSYSKRDLSKILKNPLTGS
ncbi:MAG: hypothetical protein CL455_00170 [Acidimicrobiaceae bacterium]|nr:hypothetical protein [Acidimicrobiaceae bacterium]